MTFTVRVLNAKIDVMDVVSEMAFDRALAKAIISEYIRAIMELDPALYDSVSHGNGQEDLPDSLEDLIEMAKDVATAVRADEHLGDDVEALEFERMGERLESGIRKFRTPGQVMEAYFPDYKPREEFPWLSRLTRKMRLG